MLDWSTMTYGSDGVQALNALLLRKLGAHHSCREVLEIEKKIRPLLYEKNFRKTEAIPLANGDLSIRPIELHEPSPDGYFLVRPKAEWDPSAGCSAFKRFLRTAVPARADRRVLQDYTGYCLLHWDRPFRAALLLGGPEGSGRETFCRHYPGLSHGLHPSLPGALLVERPGYQNSSGPGPTSEPAFAPRR